MSIIYLLGAVAHFVLKMKKEKRKLKKQEKIQAKKRKYAKFEQGRDKRIDLRNEEVKKIKVKPNWELTMKNDTVIKDFYRKHRRNNEI